MSTNRPAPTPPPEPTTAAEYVDRGNRYSRNGVYERAIADYTTAIELDAAHADAWFNRGISWYEVGEYSQSIADFTEAIRINPSDDNYYSAGRCPTCSTTTRKQPKPTWTKAKQSACGNGVRNVR